MESTWNPGGTVVESIAFHVEYGWNGITKMAGIITQNIFYVEWVESTWNDMDSIWIPCGMWGESKDLQQWVSVIIHMPPLPPY